MTSIISDENRVSGNWMKFAQVGDLIEGTLIDKREVVNQLSGNPQTIYEVKASEVIIDGDKPEIVEGDVYNVGGKPAIDAQMRGVKMGQIVAFKYAEEKPSTRPGFNATKIIHVFAKSGVVDEAWLKSQEEGTLTHAAIEEKRIGLEKEFNKDLDAGDDAVKEEIAKLAKEKLGATTDAEVTTKVMEETGLAFIDANLKEILEKMRAA